MKQPKTEVQVLTSFLKSDLRALASSYEAEAEDLRVFVELIEEQEAKGEDLRGAHLAENLTHKILSTFNTSNKVGRAESAIKLSRMIEGAKNE